MNGPARGRSPSPSGGTLTGSTAIILYLAIVKMLLHLVSAGRDVYDELLADERSRACILTGNYGEAGAIDFFGPERGLPNAISGHNSYYIWGPGGCTGEAVISVGVPRERLKQEFGKIKRESTVRCEYCMPDENNLPVYVCQDPEEPLREAWPLFEH